VRQQLRGIGDHDGAAEDEEVALEMALASLTYSLHDMEVAERALDAQVDAAQADAAVALQAAARGHATRRRQLLRRDDAGADAAGTGEAGTGEADADAEAADVELMAKGKARHEAAVAMQAVQRGRATRRSALRPATPVPTN
jgi:hypothetical protein